MFSATERSGARLNSWCTMAMPAPQGVGRRLGRKRLAARSVDPAVVGGMDAGRDPHQRALARPVLADQRMDFAGANVQIHAVQDGDLAESLADLRAVRKIGGIHREVHGST